MPLGNLVTKDDGWVYINAIIAYLVFFPLPEEITTSSIFLVFTLGITILTSRLASLEKIHKLIFKRQLIKSEIRRRRAASGQDYDDLSADGQDEVDKIDEYFHAHAKSFAGLLIVTLLQFSLLSLQIAEIIPGTTLDLQTINIDSIYLGVFAVVVNAILMYGTYYEIRRYMFVDLKDIYSKYS